MNLFFLTLPASIAYRPVRVTNNNYLIILKLLKIHSQKDKYVRCMSVTSK